MKGRYEKPCWCGELEGECIGKVYYTILGFQPARG